MRKWGSGTIPWNIPETNLFCRYREQSPSTEF